MCDSHALCQKSPSLMRVSCAITISCLLLFPQVWPCSRPYKPAGPAQSDVPETYRSITLTATMVTFSPNCGWNDWECTNPGFIYWRDSYCWLCEYCTADAYNLERAQPCIVDHCSQTNCCIDMETQLWYCHDHGHRCNGSIW